MPWRPLDLIVGLCAGVALGLLLAQLAGRPVLGTPPTVQPDREETPS